jgi:hypothetical protein
LESKTITELRPCDYEVAHARAGGGRAAADLHVGSALQSGLPDANLATLEGVRRAGAHAAAFLGNGMVIGN